jgi:hypothetical protein
MGATHHCHARARLGCQSCNTKLFDQKHLQTSKAIEEGGRVGRQEAATQGLGVAIDWGLLSKLEKYPKP